MENAQLRVKLDKNINKLYRQLDKQNISAADKISMTTKAIDKLVDGGDAESDTEKLVKELILAKASQCWTLSAICTIGQVARTATGWVLC